jgi:xanthine dehydrogenase accessory factor
MDRSIAEQVIDARGSRRPVALLTWLASGAQRLVTPDEDAALGDAIREAFRRDRSGTVETPDGEVFIRVYNPPLRMFIIGAVHTAQFLVPLAAMLDYDITIIDPRGAFATDERFPGVKLLAEWPDEVLPDLGLDRRTALIALTHDPKIDDVALKLALASDIFYIGALGSTHTHAKRLERLNKDGVTQETLARIHAPIGLDIGSQGPAEIALSIMSQVTAVLRGKLASGNQSSPVIRNPAPLTL